MLFFTPSYVRHGRQFIKDARKLVAFKRDLVSDEVILGVQREISHLELAVDSKDKNAIEAQMKRLDESCGKLTKPVEEAGLRENVEVVIVAIVIALAVRTYFLQPFAIPTGSMQPTLNGIIATKTETPPPNIVSQAIQKAIYFRTWIDATALADETLLSREEVQRRGIFTYTKLETSAGNTYYLHGPADVLTKTFDLQAGTTFRKGQSIARGYIDTGDHVFVDKFSYHFIRPKRDQVFVFSTRGIPKLNSGGKPSQFYIKRLAGLPNDTLRIQPPNLYINGALASQSGFKRVMSGSKEHPNKDYQGYSNAPGWGIYLLSPQEEFTVPPENYFALGDNSYNSYDSRGWGPVPRDNVTGRALFVYYPFIPHFGWIW